MSSPSSAPAQCLATDLIAACTTHFYGFYHLRSKRKNKKYRKELCHEFGRFLLWARALAGQRQRAITCWMRC